MENNYAQKFVRFQEFRSPDASPTRTDIPLKRRKSVSENVQSAFAFGSERFKKLAGSIRSFYLRKSLSDEGEANKKTILNPQGLFLQKWNKIFVLSCVIAISLDPLFLYVPFINADKKCVDLDQRMEIVACILRTLFDAFYIIHIVFQFHTGFIAPPSRVFGRGVLVQDSWEIAKSYLTSNFIVDILAVLPLPQVILLIVTPKLRRIGSLNAKDFLKSVVAFQYIPRIGRIFPLYREVTRTSGILTETAWAGAAFNLFLYMLASHMLGSLWYLFAIERETNCWEKACGGISSSCGNASFFCETSNAGIKDFLDASCPIQNPNATIFDFGIFLEALQSEVAESNHFPQKFFYCFWWGLQSLSSLGQNLRTSTYFWEIFFAVTVSISGLVLFSLLIGNMQSYLQSTTKRLEEMRVKRRDAQQWMSHRLLPESLRERIKKYEQYKWQETRGVDEDSLIRSLPKDIRREIKRHLCIDLLKRVPIFEKMDDQLLDAMSDRLKPVLYTDDSYIIREGDPVDEMLFIMRGKLFTVTTNGGRTGFFNSDYLKAGDFCGEELLTWALDPNSSANLPISTRTVQSLSAVEAFALKANDLKCVASQFRRLHSKQLRHTFRFYSQHWRTWAACFIQAGWRRYCRKKHEESLREQESRLQDALAKGNEDAHTSLGATIYASRFAANMMKSLNRNKSTRRTTATERTAARLPKPAEPDFTSL